MGHDYIDFGTRSVRLSDWDIWTLRHFFRRVAMETDPTDLGTNKILLAECQRFFESWDWICPGVCTGTDIGAFVQDRSDRLQCLNRVLETTIEYLKGFGEVIPLAYLQENVNTATAIYMAPQPIERFVTSIERLRMLLLEPQFESN